MARGATSPRGWWLCPNDPPCPHAGVFHDVDGWDDPSPACCADGCSCGQAAGHQPVK